MIIVSNIQGDFVYALTSTTVNIESLSNVSVYGISITSLKEKQNSAYVEDISDDFLCVYRLFSLIVAEELHPEHLMGVVEDYLSDKDWKITTITGYLEYHCIL